MRETHAKPRLGGSVFVRARAKKTGSSLSFAPRSPLNINSNGKQTSSSYCAKRLRLMAGGRRDVSEVTEKYWLMACQAYADLPSEESNYAECRESLAQ